MEPNGIIPKFEQMARLDTFRFTVLICRVGLDWHVTGR